MALQNDLMLAINQIAAERGIDADEVLEAIKTAILAGFRRDYPEEEDLGMSLKVDVDKDKGAFAVFADKKVVKDVSDKSTQISLKDAKKIESKLKVGDHIEVDVTPTGDFGRVAAQAAKQVILQKLRESEKDAVMEEFKDRIGEIETGVIQRMDGDSVLVEIRRATAVMEADDRMPGEFYRSGDRLKFLLKKITQGPKGKTLLISRSDPDFLRAIFELEVPEILSESVEIKAIAREEGSRSKVAVASNVEGVDPIGSFVGQKGVRINAVMNELKHGTNEEKIDIILWDENTEDFISNAFSPAQPIAVELIDEKEKRAKVIVPDDQLSLAIGKEGQNVRLAHKLTGWKIDIEGETVKLEKDKGNKKEKSQPKAGSPMAKKKKKEKKAENFDGLDLSTRVINALGKAEIKDKEDLEDKIKSGDKIPGVGAKALEEIKKALKTGKDEKEKEATDE